MATTNKTECACEECGHNHCAPWTGSLVKTPEGEYRSLGCELECGNDHSAEADECDPTAADEMDRLSDERFEQEGDR